jgi:competence protein ComFC
MKEWLANYKYRGRETLRKLLGVMLLHAYHLHKKEAPDSPVSSTYKELLTYVPLSEKRLLEWGFNQAQQLAEELGGLVGIPVIPLLERVRRTDKQSFKTRGDRLDNLQGVFAIMPSAQKALQEMSARSLVRVYIIDDVYTTGSTLDECAKVIKMQLNLSVCGISWAR